jgi:hypothetical protein
MPPLRTCDPPWGISVAMRQELSKLLTLRAETLNPAVQLTTNSFC